MAMAAAVAAALSAVTPASPSAAPPVSPTVMPTVPPTTPSTTPSTPPPIEAPSLTLAAGPKTAGVVQRATKVEMRKATGNLPAAVPSSSNSGGPSTTVGPSKAASSGRQGSGPPVGMVLPPGAQVLSLTSTRGATAAKKGKGPAKAAKTAVAPALSMAAPRAARLLAVIAPRPGGNPFATLEFRKARMPGSSDSAGSSAGAGPSRPPLIDLTVAAKGGLRAVGDDVPALASLKGGLRAPPPSPGAAVTAVVEPTSVLLANVRANRKRALPRSLSPSGKKGGPAALPAVGSTQGSQMEAPDAGGQALHSGAAAAARANVLGNDINAMLETLLTHIDDVETRLDELCDSTLLIDEKMDAAINLTQQTLMHVAAMGEKLSKELQDGFYKVRFAVSGNATATNDDAPEKTIDMIRKFLREDLQDNWAHTEVTSDVYPHTNSYWDKAVKATAAVVKTGSEGAEVFLRSMIHLPSRKDPSVYVRMRASVPVLRVKSHLHKWYGEVIWAAFVTALMPVNEVVTVSIAKELHKEHRYVLATLGKKACISAAAKLCTAVGACGRIKEPTAVGDSPVVDITLGHYAFVSMKVRNQIERIIGERAGSVVGGDGHYSMWLEELRFLHLHLPTDEQAHDGLRLVDDASPARSLPDITELSE